MDAGRKTTIVFLTLSAVALLISPVISTASPPEPVNHNQCVLAATNKVSAMAVLEAVRSCHKKFPGEGSHVEDLPLEALGRLDADGGFGYGIFSGSIYNGNSDYTLTQVTLLLTPIPAAESSLVTREYNINVTVQPLTKGALSVALISDGTREFSWSLTKARGYQTH
jgi:hypothetical protein